MTEALKSCPFCGADPISFPSGERGLGLMIECITPDCVRPHVSYYGTGEAERHWNRRAGPSDARPHLAVAMTDLLARSPETQRLIERARMLSAAPYSVTYPSRNTSQAMRDIICDLIKALNAATASPAERSDKPRETDKTDPSAVENVLIEPDVLQELIQHAYIAGCDDVHSNYQEDNDPNFVEAAYDYVASLDFTEVTRPHRPSPLPSPPEAYCERFTSRYGRTLIDIAEREPELLGALIDLERLLASVAPAYRESTVAAIAKAIAKAIGPSAHDTTDRQTQVPGHDQPKAEK